MKQRHPAFTAGQGKMEMAGEVGVCLRPFTSESQAFLSQQFGEQGFISRGGLEKALPLQRKKMGVMNIAVSRKKMNPPVPSIEEQSKGGFAQPLPEVSVLNRFSSCRGKLHEYLFPCSAGFWFQRSQHLRRVDSSEQFSPSPLIMTTSSSSNL